MDERPYSSWLLERVAVGEVLRLRVGTSTIGRSITATIRTESVYASRNHAELISNDKQLVLKELNSINGVFVNDTLVRQDSVPLKAGDRIGIGVNIPNDDEEVNEEFFVYVVKYMPIKQVKSNMIVQKRSVERHLEKTPPMLIINNNQIMQPTPLSPSPSPSPTPPEIDNKSESPIFKRRYPPLLNGAIITISDDDEEEENLVANKNSDHINRNKPKDLNTAINIDDEKTKHVIHINSVNNVNCKKQVQEDELKTSTNSNYNHIERKETVAANKSDNIEDKNVPEPNITKALQSITKKSITSDTPKEQINNDITKKNYLHAPLVSSIKNELVHNVSKEIESIFGEADELLLENVKDANPTIYPYIYNKLSNQPNIALNKKRPLVHGDSISLTSDEEDNVNDVEVLSCDKKLPKTEIGHSTTKSPNIFETSLNSSKEGEAENAEKKERSKVSAVADIEDYDSYEPREEDEDVEDIMFSQIILNDMKTDFEPFELPNSPNNDEIDLNKDITTDDNIITSVKEEPLDYDMPCTSAQARASMTKTIPSNEHNTSSNCWIISDDEDFDEELETKVSGWSNKLFSQSFNNADMSQVYELKDHDDDKDIKFNINDYSLELTDDEACGDNNYDEIDNEYYNRELDETDRIIEEMFATIKDKFNQATPESDEKTEYDDDETEIESDKDNDDITSPILRIRRKSKSLPLTSSSSSSEDEEDTNDAVDINQESKTNGIKECAVVLKRINSIAPSPPADASKQKRIDAEVITENKEIVLNKDDELMWTKETEGKEDQVGVKISTELKRKEEQIKSTAEGERKAEQTERKKSTEDAQKPKLTIVKKTLEKELTDQTKKSPQPKTPITPTTVKHCPPMVIDAPQLPRHKGKLRGVSAVGTHANEVAKKAANVRENIRNDATLKDLKRKWLEKPHVAKEREKERLKAMKKDRKERLQQLAEKEQSTDQKSSLKRKASDESGEATKCKKPNVKVTAVNRGAFLTEGAPGVPKVPAGGKKEIGGRKEADGKKDGDGRRADDGKKEANGRREPDGKKETDRNKEAKSKRKTKPENTAFEEEMAKLDILVKKQMERRKKIENNNAAAASKAVCKDAINARAQRTTNKITFASMQRNITESLENQKKLKILTSKRSCLSNIEVRNANVTRHKKTVRFNDTLIIHNIECICTGPLRKVNTKDIMRPPMSAIHERRHRVLKTYTLRDHSSEIISHILNWSNEWLITRSADATAARDGNVYPMPLKFDSYEQYKSILLPLLKMEFITNLERDYNDNAKAKVFTVILEYASINRDRIMLITKLHCSKNNTDDTLRYELVLLEFENSKYPSTFAYVTNNRKGSADCYTLVLEIPGRKYVKDELLSNAKKLRLRPVIDNLRPAFGPFNAVEQLESMPLFNVILNPLELLKYKRPLQRMRSSYKGYHSMNDQQRNILLNTYQKTIDESMPTITLIQGPPGTGKSRMITNLALHTLYGTDARILDRRILICAQSNYAIDVIAHSLLHIKKLMRENIQYNVIRFGMLEKMKPEVASEISLQKHIEHEQLRKVLKQNPNIDAKNRESLKKQIAQLKSEIAELNAQNIKGTVQEDELAEKQKQLQLMQNIAYGTMRPEDERNIYRHYLATANIVCTTLSSCVKLSQYIDYFDICIIDEATQCTEPWTLVPLRFGINALVLVGDAQQLPATVLSKKACDLGLRTSLFTRIQRCLASHKFEHCGDIFNILQTQYRMHPEICKWPNAYFYKNQLKNGSITLQYESAIVPFAILNLAYSQNDNCDNGKIVNNLEAEFVVKLVNALDAYLPNKSNSYGIITPYALHRDTLSTAIKVAGIPNIMVNTIDSYQGLEKDVIIISNARTRGIGFLNNYQRLNVALTRPKKCLILCGNFANLESVPAWRSLLNNARERKLYHEISVDCVKDIQTNVIAKLKVQK